MIVWTLLNLLAYIGYGQFIRRIAKKNLAPWPFAGVIGISCLLAIGGYLNLAHYLTRAVLGGAIALGLCLWLLSYRDQPPKIFEGIRDFQGDIRFSPWKLSVSLVAVGLIAGAFFGNLVRSRFNPADDLIAYAGYAVQTSQLGTLPADPFGDRRIVSGLGSGYLLQAITLVFGDARSIYVPDVSLGYLLAFAAAYFIARRKLSRQMSLSIGLLVFIFAVYVSNATFYILPEALVLTLFWMATEQPAPSPSWSFTSASIGVVAAALATLKSTYIPFSVLFCSFLFLSYLLLYQSRYILRGALACAGGAAVVMLPWMYDQHIKEGTWLFPLLGRGFDVSAYPGLKLGGGRQGLLTLRWDVWEMSLPFIALWTVIFVFLLARRGSRRDGAFAAILAGVCSACLGTLALNAATGADSVTRYTAPFQVPIVIALVVVLCEWMQEEQWALTRLAGLAVTTAALSVFFIWNGDIRQGMLRQYIDFVDPGAPTDTNINVAIDYADIMKTTHSLQNSVPIQETIFAATYPSFGFDALRNRILTADFLGMAGPPPVHRLRRIVTG